MRRIRKKILTFVYNVNLISFNHEKEFNIYPPTLTQFNSGAFRRLLSAGLAFCCLLLAACSDDEQKESPTPGPEPDEPAIVIPDTEDTAPVIAQEGGTATVSFTATADWTAEATAVTRALDWVSVQPASGTAGDVTLTITTQPNDTYDERNAAIVLACAGERTTFTVSQKQKDALLLTSDKVELDATGGGFTLELQANVPVTYEIEPGADWLKPAEASTKALEDLSFAFHAEENPDTESRQATITLSGNGLAETVTVFQAGTVPVLVLGQQEYIVGSTGETIAVELQSNTDYRVQLPAVDWIAEADTRSLSAYTHYFAVAPNDTYDARTAEIIFVAADGTLADTVFVTQVQQDAILLAQQEYDIPAEGGTLDFTVQANVDVTATPDVDWITQAPGTRGLVEKNLCFDIAPNEGTEARQGTITLSGGGVMQAITVRQEAYEESELVRVEYRTGYTWEEAHDNLPLLYYATVYRDRYYSNGEVITDTFVDVGHMVSFSASRDPEKAGSYSPEDEISIIYSEQTFENSDQHLVIKCSLQVSDIEALSTEIGRDEPDPAGNWNEYVISKTYDANSFISASDVPCNQEWGTDNRQQGWYFSDCGFMKRLDVCYQGKQTIYQGMCCYNITMEVYDQFLVIDGRRIDFLEYRPDFHFNLLTKDIPNGIEHTYECNFEFMGRNFYVAVINTITQL